MWVEMHGNHPANLLTEIGRTRNTIELQDPKTMTRIVIQKQAGDRGVAKTIRRGGAMTLVHGTLSTKSYSF